MPAELAGRIDVYVLDVSRAKTAKHTKKKNKAKKKKTRAKSAATTKTRTKAAKKVTAKPSGAVRRRQSPKL